MKKRFSVEQITGILKQAELGAPIAELCGQHRISEQCYWRHRETAPVSTPTCMRHSRAAVAARAETHPALCSGADSLSAPRGSPARPSRP